MTRCLTFQCQEQLPGVGHCVARARAEELHRVIVDLINEAMPDNWYEDDLAPEHVAAWEAAMVAVGIDPETMRPANG